MRAAWPSATLWSRLILALLIPFGCIPDEHHADINGVTLYYEVHGSGEPVLLLHGGFASSEAWEGQIPELSRFFQVIAMDSRGHGRSTDAEIPITYETLAADAVGLLDYLNISKAHVVGWSDGGVAGLQMGIHHPGRLDKLVTIGASAYGPGSMIPLIDAFIFSEPWFKLLMSFLFRPDYDRLSPNPEHWPEFLDKMYALWTSDCYFLPEEGAECMSPLGEITSEVLVMAGSLEMIRTEHTQALYEHLAYSELLIIPWGTHMVMMEQPAVVNEAILGFLNH